MVIQRIREHATTHNWFAVGVDLAIVVLGVFLGTQVSNWNDERLERAHARDYRLQIIDELRSNEQDLDARKAYYRQARNHALATLAGLDRPLSMRGEAFVVDAYQASQVWLRPVIRSGYDEMSGAGLSSKIGDRATRSRLTTFYSQIRQFDITALNTTTYRDRVRRAISYPLQQEINRRCGDRVTYLPSGAQIAVLPEHCDARFDSALVRNSLTRLEAAQLEGDLTRHISDLDQKLEGFDRFSRLSREVRELLQRQDRR
jgi:hypothetical protein